MTIKKKILAALLLASFELAGAPATAQTHFPQRTRPSNRQTTAVSPQLLRQYERVYISTSGELLGAHTILGGTVLFIDRAGDVDLVARDYTAELDYDYTGRLNRIGAATIDYDYRGRVEQIGRSAIDYDFRSRLGQVGSDAIAYTPRGKVAQIGSVSIQYDRGSIATISSNYTNAGTQVVVVGRRWKF